MIHLIVRIDARPERLNEFLTLVGDHAEDSRLEPGCFRFDVLRDPEKPARRVLHETWTDRAALQAHRRTPHYARWRLRIASIEESPRKREEYEGPPELVPGSLLPVIAADARARGRKVVFTNGCYDGSHGPHLGHVHCLEQARMAGDVLLVAVNDDNSVRRLKGPGRPLVPATGRVEALAALQCVDHVCLFSEDTPIDLIRAVRPCVLAKGSDYELHQVVGAEHAGRVLLVPHLPGYSTTQRIREAAS